MNSTFFGQMIRTMRRSHYAHEFFLFLLIVLTAIVISAISQTSFTLETFLDILKSSSTYMVMAIGVLIVMVSGGIDVSFSSIAAVAAYISVYAANTYGGGNIWTALLAASAVGIALGAVNAILISLFKLPTLIVTLATSNIFYGLLLQNVPTAHISKVPTWIGAFGAGRIFSIAKGDGSSYGFSNLAFIAIVLLVTFAIILKYTSLGRNIYAIGSSRESAIRAGIPIWRTQFFIYCFVGFLAGIASIINTSLISYVNPFNIQGLTMDIIAAVVLGGAALAGGKGTILGTFLGVTLLFMIKSSLIQLGVPSTWDSIIVGGVLIVSIAVTMIQSSSKKKIGVPS